MPHLMFTCKLNIYKIYEKNQATRNFSGTKYVKNIFYYSLSITSIYLCVWVYVGGGGG